MDWLCKYKNLFGEPRKGIHSIRLFDIAIVDVLLTILVGFIIAKLTHTNLMLVLGLLFLLSIFIHKIFCVRTKVIEMLFG
jgi:uncharacterized membrane protein YcaP (DUF421 family)